MSGHGRWGAQFRRIQQERAAERQLEEMLRGMNGPRLAGPDLSERILARVSRQRVLLDGAERRWSMVGRAGVMAATIAAAAGLGVLWMAGGSTPEPEPVETVLRSVRTDTARTVMALPGLAIDLAASLGGPGAGGVGDAVGEAVGDLGVGPGIAAPAGAARWTNLGGGAALSTNLFRSPISAQLDERAGAAVQAGRADAGAWPGGLWREGDPGVWPHWSGWSGGASGRPETGYFLRLWTGDGLGRNEPRLPR